MKPRSLSLVLYHFKPGHHREIATWHDTDHRPEVLGTVPDVYISQRWVAPPNFVSARPKTELPFDGGEYSNMYWSQGQPEALHEGIQANGKRLAALDRRGPMPLLDRTWGARMHVLDGQTRPDLPLSPEAVISLPDTALIVEINAVPDADFPEYDRQAREQRVPALLKHPELAAAVSFAPVALDGTRVHLYYSLGVDPLRALATVAAAPEAGRRTYLGVYRLNPPGDYAVYN